MLLLLNLILFISETQPVDSTGYITLKQFSINGITIGTDVKELINKFGKPDSIKKEPIDVYDRNAFHYYYPGIVFYVADGIVDEPIDCISPKYSTFDGMRVGDSIDKLFSVYGQAHIEEIGDDKRIFYIVKDSSQTWMVFIITNNKISQISLQSPP